MVKEIEMLELGPNNHWQTLADLKLSLSRPVVVPLNNDELMIMGGGEKRIRVFNIKLKTIEIVCGNLEYSIHKYGPAYIKEMGKTLSLVKDHGT